MRAERDDDQKTSCDRNQEHEQAEDDADPGIADDVLAPRFLDQLDAAADRLDGAHVFGRQHGNDQRSGDTPGKPDQANDDSADEAHTLHDDAKSGSDSRGNERVSKDYGEPRNRAPKSVGNPSFLAVEALQRDFDER